MRIALSVRCPKREDQKKSRGDPGIFLIYVFCAAILRWVAGGLKSAAKGRATTMRR
jgi:hypothetical protein